jgi:hypothetical protein
MALIGYARISTDDGRQTTLRQLDELRAAGCTEVLEEHANGTDRARPVLNRLLAGVLSALAPNLTTRAGRRVPPMPLLAGLEPGTTVCVVKLDRLARSTKDLLNRDRPEPGGLTLACGTKNGPIARRWRGLGQGWLVPIRRTPRFWTVSPALDIAPPRFWTVLRHNSP